MSDLVPSGSANKYIRTRHSIQSFTAQIAHASILRGTASSTLRHQSFTKDPGMEYRWKNA
jgi:hypothetical protein